MSDKKYNYRVFLEDKEQYTFRQIKEFLTDQYELEDTKKNGLCLIFKDWKLNIDFNSKKVISRKGDDMAYEYGNDALYDCSCALDIYTENPVLEEAGQTIYTLLENLHQSWGGIHIFDTIDLYFPLNNIWEPELGESYLDVNFDFVEFIPKNAAVNAKISKAQITPSSAGNWNNLGIEYYNLKNYSVALSAFQNATLVDENYHWAHYNSGLCYANLDKNEEAEAAYKQSIAVAPTYINAINNLARLYIKLGKNDLGLSYFEMASTVDSNDSSSFTSFGFYQLLFGYPEKAIVNIEKAISLGDHSFSNLNKGHYYLIKGDREKAIACYKASKAAFNNDTKYWQDFDSDYEVMPQYNISKEDYEALKALI